MSKPKPASPRDIKRWQSEADRTMTGYARIVDVDSTYPRRALLTELLISLLHLANGAGLPVEEIWKESFRLFKLGLGERWPE